MPATGAETRGRLVRERAQRGLRMSAAYSDENAGGPTEAIQEDWQTSRALVHGSRTVLT